MPNRGSRSFGAKNNDPLEVIVFTDHFERLSWPRWGVSDKQPRWGRKPCSWAKYHDKRGQNQGFPSTICVDDDLHFFPQLDRLPAVRCFLFRYSGNPIYTSARIFFLFRSRFSLTAMSTGRAGIGLVSAYGSVSLLFTPYYLSSLP